MITTLFAPNSNQLRGQPANFLVVFALIVVMFGSKLGSSSATAGITAEQARESIRSGIVWLKEAQKAKGNWAQHGRYKGGATALCTLALINSGVPVDDPHVKKALDYLRDIGRPDQVYPVALQTMVFAIAEPERDRLALERNVRWLEKIQVKDTDFSGGWGYGETRRGSPDNSNSQFAVLALNEAQRAGITVNKKTWGRAFAYWAQRQERDGSWGYRRGNGRGSMTCAGITSMIIAGRNLNEGDARVVGNRVRCCSRVNDDDAVDRGISWLARNFSVSRNPATGENSENWLFYYLYGLERVGRLSGRRFVGSHDWYREGSEFFVNRQQLDGSWKGQSLQNYPHVSTSFALLFLSKGRRPVVISKLAHLPEGDWNRHRQDIGNLTRHIEKLWELDMTWQTIDHRRATVSDLLQSPILFLSGKTGLKMAAQEKESLKAYIEQGGFVFAEACCGGKAFDADFRKLMTELFPDNPLRLLPPDHPVWYAEQAVDSKHLRELYGIDTCCRTSVVYCPGNLGCYWELAREGAIYYRPAVREEIDAMLAIGTNVVAYATNRELREKLDAPVSVAGSEDDFERGSLSIAKLQHAGGSDEAPAALSNMLRSIGTQLGIRVNTSRLLLPATDESLADFPVAYIHGRRDFSWSQAERDAIVEFTRNGGVVFGDSICASKKFTDAIRRELQATFPDHPLQRIPPGHEIFSDKYKGNNLERVDLRRPRKRNEAGQAAVDKVTPVLEGIEIDGRYVVIFSPYDISCALESLSSNDCEGYTSKDAARICTNVLLYVLQQ